MIVSIGDINVDVLLLPELVEAEQPSGMVLRGGGSAANTAAWLSFLGEEAGFVGCVSDDVWGRLLTEELERAGVFTRVRAISGRETGSVAVEVTADARRVMRSSRGANGELTVADVESVSELRPSLVHLTGYSLLNPAGLDLIRAAGRIASETGARLSFDPSSTTVVARLGRRELCEALADADVAILLPNSEEARVLTDESDEVRAADALARTFAFVAIKDAVRGAVVASGGEIVRVAGNPEVERLDATGAGDAFNAGVLVGLGRGLSSEEATRIGIAAAEQAIVRYGGRPPAA